MTDAPAPQFDRPGPRPPAALGCCAGLVLPAPPGPAGIAGGQGSGWSLLWLGGMALAFLALPLLPLLRGALTAP